jgi:hypothetical protein
MTYSSSTEVELRAALERVRDRHLRREHPPVRRIPRDKAEFPKVLCLDMNQWVYLARAHHGVKDGERFADALAAVREAIASGRLVVPILRANLDEANEHPDPAVRHRLAEFMVELSQNHSMVSNMVVRRRELQVAVANLFLDADETFPREILVRWGMFAAIGREPTSADGDDMVQLVVEAMHEPELSMRTLIDGSDRQTIGILRQQDQAAAARLDAIREITLLGPERPELEFEKLFESGSTADLIKQAVRELGIEPEDFDSWLRDNIEVFARRIPSIDVVSRLMFERDKNVNNRAKPNDIKDSYFLELAIPYANIVLTEKQWAHLANNKRLATDYGTVVTAKTTQLRSILEGSGCLET